MKKQDIEEVRHSLAHVLAYAVQELYPNVKLGMGPAIENGFYYDFLFPEEFSGDDLPRVEKKMKSLLENDFSFEKDKIDREKAERFFKDQPFKLELLEDMDEISIYKSGSFVDLCAGPHVQSTEEIPTRGFKLDRVAGAYWKGSEDNRMLTRIYGLAFENNEKLEEYIRKREEAKKRDHRKLGKELNLFVFSDLVGKGLPLFTEKGAAVWRQLERYVVDEEIKRGYKHVRTPNIAKTELYKTSGHYPYYKDTMYPPMQVDEDELILRPMTCPHHFALYMSKPRSYRELPLRLAEMASLYRYEKSGELTGLIRVREFCLADSHNFVAKEQAAEEVKMIIELIREVAQAVGLEEDEHYTYRLSLGDRDDKDKYYDAPEEWDYAEKALRKVLKEMDASYYEAEDEAAFYGPKIDIQMFSVMGKENTAFTVQYDLCLPERFDLEYINEDGEKEQPVVIHRSSIGALERTIGFLIEHYNGAFPLWLAPEQVWVLPIAEDHKEYAHEVLKKLQENNLRGILKDERNTLSKRIREAEMQKVPYVLVIGDREVENNKVAVRHREQGDLGASPLDKVIKKLKEEVDNKVI